MQCNVMACTGDREGHMSATFSAVRLARWVSHRLPAMVLLAAALPLLGACDSFRSAFKIHDIDPKKSFAQSAKQCASKQSALRVDNL